MKCQKCGTSLPEEYLYCSECGTEYQIVPNFEPEIENSIAKTMLDVGDSIITEEPDTALYKKDTSLMEKEEGNRWIYSAAICTILFFLLVVVGVIFYHNSIFYFKKSAQKAVNEGEYHKATEFYDRLRKKDPENVTWYLEEAKLELLHGDRDTAIQLSYRALNETIENQEIYIFLLELLIEEKAYGEVYDILKECTYENILEEYQKYNSTVGKLSHEGGNYQEIIKLTLEDSSEFVYYTLDGSTPDSTSRYYTEPIVLGNGTHTISFLPYNEFGIPGEIIRKEFIIQTTTPVAPIVFPESSVLEQPEMIHVEIEPGSKVYYTTDGKIPNENSSLYEEPIPIPLGISEFTFIAISDNNHKSEITKRKYELNLTSSITLEEAEKILMEQLILNGHILDMNGAIQNRYGVFRYFYRFPLRINENNFYVFEEHYLENLIDNPLKNYYGVHMENKTVYPLKKDFMGRYSIDFFKN